LEDKFSNGFVFGLLSTFGPNLLGSSCDSESDFIVISGVEAPIWRYHRLKPGTLPGKQELRGKFSNLSAPACTLFLGKKSSRKSALGRLKFARLGQVSEYLQTGRFRY
jgi:hypothetical protein